MPYPAKIDPDGLADVALRVAEAKGWDAWSLRDVAAALGVSPNALYRHVEDRDGLVVNMGAAAAGRLAAAITVDRGGDPIDTLVVMAQRYVRFAARHPAAYEAVVRAKPGTEDPRRAAWYECWQIVLDAVGRVAPQAVEACALALWSALHGRVDLARGPTAGVDPAQGLDHLVRALATGFAAAGAVPSPMPTVPDASDPAPPGAAREEPG